MTVLISDLISECYLYRHSCKCFASFVLNSFDVNKINRKITAMSLILMCRDKLCFPLYCDTVLLWYCATVILWYCVTVILWYCDTVLLCYCDTVILCYCDTVLLWYCVTVILWYCVTVLLWYCDTVRHKWSCEWINRVSDLRSQCLKASQPWTDNIKIVLKINKIGGNERLLALDGTTDGVRIGWFWYKQSGLLCSVWRSMYVLHRKK
jgi:hypothetical protein